MQCEGQLLLVENLRKNGTKDWSTPGGVVEHGEEPIDGLTREVFEETGLRVTQWSAPTYTVETIAADMGWHLTVFVYQALEWTGDVTIGADPDGIVVGARFVAPHECGALLHNAGRWVSEPVMDWVGEPWSDLRAYKYHLHGRDRDSLHVERM
jgi:ADP-ribose pyrophosphatase YjhB (NUDIX family)